MAIARGGTNLLDREHDLLAVLNVRHHELDPISPGAAGSVVVGQPQLGLLAVEHLDGAISSGDLGHAEVATVKSAAVEPEREHPGAWR